MRRTAIYLLREFGGSEALPDLTVLLDDTEPQVQREAIRAMLNIGTAEAYRALQQALTNGTPQSREAIMHAVGLIRDERATPLFVYILGHIDHRGPLRPVYLRAMGRSERYVIPRRLNRSARRSIGANGGRHAGPPQLRATAAPRSRVSAHQRLSRCFRRRQRRLRGASAPWPAPHSTARHSSGRVS